jgi:hypothetical protein
MDVYKPVYPGLYYFDTFTFTTLGTSGRRGPESTKTYANAPWNADQFSIVDGQQQWTVPATGTYLIEAAGAYGATPGRVVSGDVNLNEGQVVSLLVGQQPNPLVANVADNVTVGGGGGTFVTVDGKPLIVASGGDGGAYSDNPWSQPVIVPFSSGTYVGVTLFADQSGTYFTRGEYDVAFQGIGTRLYEYDGANWNSTFLFAGDEACYYVNKTLGVAYSFSVLDNYTVRASDWSYTNGTWTKTTYVDLSLPFQTGGQTQVSGNGETLRIADSYNSTWAMYKRIDNQWVYITTLPGVPYGMSYDGNRIINSSGGYIDIYDYPWTSPPTQILLSGPIPGNNECKISPDGTLLVSFSNVYSLSDGSLVTSLPGYAYGPQPDLNISKDNKTIVKGFIGSDLQVLDYPFTQVNAVLSPVTAYSFYGSPFISEDGSVIIGSDALSGTSVYYKSFKSQSGLFLPSGTGGGDSGAGFLGDGAQNDPYFQFLKPQAYVDGGFGNSYQYGTQGEGGFGGGQGPLNKSNKLTQFTISESPSTFSLGGNPQVVSVNSDATVMYYGTTRYLYSGGSWNYDQDFGYTGINGFLSVSDDGMTAVTYTTAYDFGAINNIPIGIVTGTQRYIVSGYVSRVNKQGTRVAYSVYPGPNVFIRDVPFSGGDYQLTLPASFPLDSNVSSFDFSSDGSVLAIGFNVGSTGYEADGALRILITRYPWTTYETINNVGNIVALSPDGQTLFAAVNSADASFIYKYEYTYQSEWQRVSRTSSGYKNTIYLATGSDGSLFVKPSDISLNYSGYPSLVFNFTAYNGDFSQVGSVSNSYVSNMSSDGQHLVNYDGASLKFYNKQAITANTLVDHGFPHSYQVKYELTANYNGIHDITVTSANTFTFQGFCFANESGNLGTVSGVETGISGGGGYTGSSGDGVSGATCYGAGTITDLGATSNSAGYVTVTLVDPAPVKQGVVLNPWAIQPTVFAPTTTWSAVAYGNGVYVSVSNNGTFPVMYSTNGLDWLTNTTGAVTGPWTSVTFGNGKFVAVSADGTVMYSLDGIKWVNSYEFLYTIGGGRRFGFYSMAMSSDGSIIASSANNPYVYVYKNEVLIYKITENVLYGGIPIAMNGDGSIIATGQFYTGTDVRVYTNGVLTKTYTGGLGFGSSIAMSSDGRVLAIVEDYNSFYVYKDGVLDYTLNDDTYYNVVTNYDGSVIAVSTYSGLIKVYNNNVLSYTILSGSNPTGCFFMSSDGSIIATGIYIYTNGVLTKTYTIEGDYIYFYISAMSSDGSVIVTTKAYFGEGYVLFLIKIYKNGVLTNTINGDPDSAFGQLSTTSSNGSIIATSAPDINLVYVYKFNIFVPYSVWSHVTHGNDNFVTVSSNTVPTSMFSTDGINWVTGNAQLDSWTGVTYGNGQFVAVSRHGSVAYSVDGNVWSNVTTGTLSNAWTTVSYGNGQFVAISSNVTSMYSSNGVNWVEGGSPGVSSNCLTFGDGYFVCPSSNSGVSAVSISTNGQIWRQIALTYTPGLYSGIVYGEPGFVAVSSTGLLFGFIPTFWVNPTQVASSTKLNSVNWSGLTYGNGSFVAVGQGLIQTSTDNGNTWASFAVSNTLASITYSSDSGTFVALPDFFRDGVYTSTDGSTWTLSQTLPNIPSASTSVTYGNGKFVAVMNGSSNVFYSIDGINWSVGTSSSGPWSSVTHGNGKFVAVSNDGDYPVMFSSDGLGWTTIASEYILYSINVDPAVALAMNHDGSVLAICNSYSVFVYTNQILTNTFVNIYPGSIDMSSDGSVIIVACNNGFTAFVNVYKDGVLNYTFSGEDNTNYGRSITINDDGTIFAIAAPGNNFNNYVYVYNNGTLIYTLNGYAVGTSMAMNSDGSILVVGAVDAGYVNVYKNGELAYTMNGVGGFGWCLATNSDGSIIAVGTYTGNTVYVYKDGILLYTFTGTDFFGGSIAMSSDGSIIAVSARTGGYIYIYNNGISTKKFLHPGFYPVYANGVGVRLSSDGSVLLNFSPENSPVYAYNINLLNKTNWSSVTYGKGVFVMVANGNNSMYSSDAISWFNGNAPVDSWTSVSYGDGFFVAVSDNGTYPVMYSQDGINWSTTDPGSQFNNWGSVAFGGDTFLAIPTSGATTMTAHVTKTF